jgi:hypothetical protein
VLSEVQRVTLGITALAEELKRAGRDRREPKRREKLVLEERIRRALQRRFRRQRAKLEAYLQTLPRVKDYMLPLDLFDDEENGELIRLMLKGAAGGVEQFAETVSVGYDWSMVNMSAAEWAANAVGELIKAIDEVTRKAIQKAIELFITTPGMTIGDVMGALPFGEERARTIAVTEITRAYAQGQLMAGEDLRKAYPDVKVTKVWNTNADDFVCDICGPLDGAEVGLDEQFEGGIDEPPAHVNCRCWMQTRTRI